MATPVIAEEPLPVTLDPALLANAKAVLESGLEDELGYQLIASLTTEVGPRLAGTPSEQRAREWAVAKFTSLGFANVRVEPFEVPYWNRLVERAEIVSPFPQPLVVTALGGSPGTGPKGVRGELVAFDSLLDLQAAADGSHPGRIVLVDEVMTRTQDGSGYGVAAGKRYRAAYEAERVGAVAALIRSVGTSSHRFAHTGQMGRPTDDGARGVPTGAISGPDADQLRRALQTGQSIEVQVTLTTESRPSVPSGNVVAELVGRERPEEIVLVGAHLDSWDLGTGAVDDGAGVGIVMAATKLLMEHFPHPPRRTIRVVLFGSEEVGLVGARAYARQHADDLGNHVIGTESDFGADRVYQFTTRVPEDKLPLMEQFWKVLKPLGIGPGNNKASGGPDMRYVREAGVPVVSLRQSGWDYFDLHHTPDDTLDKIKPENIAQNVAAYATFLYLAAEVETYFR